MGGKKQKNPNINWSHKNDFQIEEVWNTYHTIAQLIVPRLQAFKALDKHGYCPYFKDMREWNCAIQKMIDAFELMKYTNTYSEDEKGQSSSSCRRGSTAKCFRHLTEPW